MRQGHTHWHVIQKMRKIHLLGICGYAAGPPCRLLNGRGRINEPRFYPAAGLRASLSFLCSIPPPPFFRGLRGCGKRTQLVPELGSSEHFPVSHLTFPFGIHPGVIQGWVGGWRRLSEPVELSVNYGSFAEGRTGGDLKRAAGAVARCGSYFRGPSSSPIPRLAWEFNSHA